jgi:hypothetical protein
MAWHLDSSWKQFTQKGCRWAFVLPYNCSRKETYKFLPFSPHFFKKRIEIPLKTEEIEESEGLDEENPSCCLSMVSEEKQYCNV